MTKLPEALEMEKKLLSAMMLKDGEVIAEVSAIVRAEDFYREEHRCIYRAMQAVYSASGTPPDVLLVEEELQRTGEINKVRHDYLFALIDYEFTTSRAVKYAETIKEKATLRRLIETCEEITEAASDEQKPVKEILEEAERRLFSATLERATKFEPIMTIMQRAFERVISKAEHPDEITGVPTKLIGLDRVLNGLQKSDLIILAARPSMGKTALALNIATNAAKSGASVAIFSLEMSKGQIAERLMSTLSGVNSQNMKTGTITDSEMRELINAVEEIAGLDLHIDDTAGMSLMEMRSKLRRLAHEAGLDLIVIDYIQLMQGVRAENRQQEISEISRSLKALAREMNVPILALSQLSRSVEMRADKKPQLSDLRESGSLEQDADIVMFLYRDEYYNRDEESNKNIAELIIAKNRNGPTTAIGLQFQKETMRFGDLTRAAE